MANSDTRSSSNPNFEANMSSDEIYFGQDMETCITDVVNDKADLDHTHSEYVTQSDLESLGDIIDTKADSTHSHTEYATTTALAALETEIDGKANVNHSHTEYALVEHSHDNYALSSHSHSDYASINHDHDEDYASVNHIHSNYATTSSLDEVSATVANKANVIDLNSHINNTALHITEAERTNWNAKSDFSGSYNDLTNKPNIPSIDGLATEDYVDTQISAINIPSALSDLTTDSTHRVVTDTEKTAWNAKSNFSGSYNDLVDKPSIPSISGLATETYVDEAVSSKANASHSHAIADVTGLQSALDGKSASSHNHDSRYYTETEVNSLLSNKSDSTHTHDSSYDALGTAETKANVVQANLNVVSNDLTEHIENADIHFTAAERTKLSGIATNANNYAHPNSGVTAGTYKSVTVNAQGHITGGTNPTTLAGYGITDADAKGSANSALVSAKAYADELIADEVTNRNSAISTAKSSAISTASSDATTKANNALSSAKSYTDTKIAALVDSAPETMDTLKEVADAISAHEDVTDALNAAIGTKANASDLTSHTGNKSNPHAVTKSQVGLGNVPNVATNDQTPTYSDATTLATLVSGEKLSVAFGKIKFAITNLINHIANKSNPHSVTKAQVGLSNVDNTSDANKPISTATQSALDGKASSSHTHGAATTSTAGFMSASDKSKLDGITASADSVLFSRSLTSGTKVGTITINGTGTDLYAPTNTDTHYVSGTVVNNSTSAISNTTSALANGKVYINHIENGSVKNSHKISGSGATTVTSDASGNIVVSSANTTYGVATSSSLGLVKSGTDITVDSSGNVSVNDDSHNHVISNIDNLQSSLDAKQATVTGAASTITSSNLTTNRALVSNSSGKVAVSAVTSTELGYLDGVTSNVQTQLDGKAASSHNHSASNITSGTLSSDRLPTVPIAKGGTGATTAAAALTNLGIAATASELNYMDGVTSNVQTQLNGKTQRITLTGQLQCTSYRTSVIALCLAPTTATSNLNSYSAGRLVFQRTNALYAPVIADVSMAGAYGAINRVRARILRSGDFSIFKPCTFTYNGVSYGGIEVKTSDAEAYRVTFDGVTTFNVFGLDIYDSNTSTVLNTEVYESLTYDTVIVANSWFDNDKQFITSANIGSQSVNYATSAGAASTATKATQDAGGNVITSTYATKTELNTEVAKKANTSHTHNYAGSSSAGGAATSANKLNTNAGSATNPVYFANGVPVKTTYTLGKSVPSNAVFTDTTYSNATTSASGLMSASDKSKLDGIASGANAYTLPAAGSSLGGVKSGGDVTISSGTITVNDDSHNHVIANVDGLQTALNGKSATSHNHDNAYISKDLQFTDDDGDAELQLASGSGLNLLTKIAALGMGLHTFYSASGNAGNPKTTEAWRGIVFKTGTNYGFVQAYGSIGSVYTNYLDGSNSWRGWKCIWDNSPAPLWTGAKYMSSTDGTPQVVTPSKKLSECQHGWLLLWSDYDPGDGANDADFVTTMIPKRNASGGTWGGKSFLCDIPRYVGSDPTDTSTEKRIIKPIYVHDDCIKGSYQNASGDRNDVVLRAVYEY